MRTLLQIARHFSLPLCLTLLSGCATPPDPSSPEFKANWGLSAVNAEPAFRAGATGRGVTIGLIDCGAENSGRDVQRNLSRKSIDLLPDRALPQPERHATWVAGPMDAALDGTGLMGVAFNAKLLSIRADFDGGYEGQCAFYARDIARGIDYARENGARILVMPLVTRKPMGPVLESALQRAIDANIAVVIAAGNDGKAQPAWPGRYAADPRYAGGIIVVGASRRDGTLVPWSNQAGEAGKYFVAAPGEGILTDCSKKLCTRVSGTSFSTSFVAGALALVMEGRPNLPARDAINIVLQSARPLPLPDDIAGRGILDIGEAFAELSKKQNPA